MMRLSGSVKFSCALSAGNAELALVAPALGLAIRAPRAAVVVVAAAALQIGLALALLQPLAGLADGRQPRLAPLDLGR